MLETDPNRPATRAPASTRRRVAVGAVVAVAATAGWAGYRMLDPAASPGGHSTTCYSTAAPGSSVGAITTVHLMVERGQTVTVQSIELLDAVNFRLAGTGVQRVVGGIGVAHYPVRPEDSEAQAAWDRRSELPAMLGDGTSEAAIMAVEPLDAGGESFFRAVRVAYSGPWGLPYSKDLPTAFEARPDCLADAGGTR